MIRDGALNTVVQMRSNDAWAGYRNDYAWHQYVTKELLKQYNDCIQDPSDSIVLGQTVWQAGSLHVYSRQFYLIENYISSLAEP
jgi:thymidylate synthase